MPSPDDIRALLQGTLDAIDDAVKIVSPDYDILYINRAAEVQAARKCDAVSGKTCYKELRGRVDPCPFCVLRSVIETGRSEQVEYTSDDHQGNRRIYRQHVYELKNDRGNLIGAVEVTRDITEQRAVERQLYQREKLAALGQLSASIAHEIRNPLAGIRLGIDTMLEDAKDSDARQALDAISDDIRRLNGVLNQLLDFSRRKDSERSRLMIPDVIERSVFFIRQQARSQKVEIATTFEKNLPEVIADADQLQQVFLNLMLNSIQAMEAGGIVSITVACMTHEGRSGLQIRVSDTGQGFPAHVKEKLFDMFFSTKPGGSGVGLAIANRIITEHDGEIWIENAENGGATVTVFLPTGNPDDPT